MLQLRGIHAGVHGVQIRRIEVKRGCHARQAVSDLHDVVSACADVVEGENIVASLVFATRQAERLARRQWICCGPASCDGCRQIAYVDPKLLGDRLKRVALLDNVAGTYNCKMYEDYISAR